MNNSPTEGGAVTPASNEPTGQVTTPVTSAESNQETISHEQSQGTVSTTPTEQKPKQTEENGGGQADDGLAKFAKAQGFDPENLTDGERRALKIAHDNQKALRSQGQPKVTDTAKELHATGEGTTDDEKFRAEFRQFKYEQATEKFWSDEKLDRSLEPSMVEILNEKKEQYGPDYARTLSEDLPTLYGLAQLRSGANGGSVDTEAIRREERESIRKKANASEGGQHASNQGEATLPTKIDREWLANHYDPSNPEHRKLVDEAVANGDLN